MASSPLPSAVIGYIRVSTDEQELGPEGQHNALERWAETNGVQLVAVYSDLGLTGALPPERRPGLMAALTAVRTLPGSALLVYRRDRLARSTGIITVIEGYLKQTQACVISTSGEGGDETDPASVMMRGIIDLFSQYERAVIRMRVTAALGVLKRRGQRVSRYAPIGLRFTENGTLVPHQEELAVVQQIVAWHRDGLGVRRIAERLNREHQGLCRGARWHKTTVHQIIRQQEQEEQA